MRIKALIASIDVRSGTKQGKPWKMATMLLIEKAANKDIPRLKTPLTLRISDEDMDIADRASEYEDTVLVFDITGLGYDDYNEQIEARGFVVRQTEAAKPADQSAAAKQSTEAKR